MCVVSWAVRSYATWSGEERCWYMDHIIRKRIETEFHPNSMNRNDLVLNRSWKPLIYTELNGGGIISINTCIMMASPLPLSSRTDCICVLFFSRFPFFTSCGSFHSCASFTCLAELAIALSAVVFETSLTSFPFCIPKPLQTHLTSVVFACTCLTHLLGQYCSCSSLCNITLYCTVYVYWNSWPWSWKVL